MFTPAVLPNPERCGISAAIALNGCSAARAGSTRGTGPSESAAMDAGTITTFEDIPQKQDLARPSPAFELALSIDGARR